MQLYDASLSMFLGHFSDHHLTRVCYLEKRPTV